MESRLHAIPGIVTGPAALPRSAPGLAIAKRTESGGRGDELPSRQRHYPPGDVLDEIAVMKWALLAAIDRVRVRGGAVRGAPLARSPGGRRCGATLVRHDLGRCSPRGRRARLYTEQSSMSSRMLVPAPFVVSAARSGESNPVGGETAREEGQGSLQAGSSSGQPCAAMLTVAWRSGTRRRANDKSAQARLE